VKLHPHSMTAEGQKSPGGMMYVPSSIYTMVPPDTRFRCEIVEEGILFRRLVEPSWTVSNGTEDVEAST
jgi:hypothetical protein